jgi:hypothetical protein
VTTIKFVKNPDWWMVALTAMLLVVGVVTLKVFHDQFFEMTKQTGIRRSQAAQAAADSVEASKKIEEQLAISRQQADAFQNSVQAIQRQMRVDQRAWLRIEMDNVAALDSKPLAVPLTITNTGKTPAENIHGYIAVYVFKRGEESEFTYKPHTGHASYWLDAGAILPSQPIIIGRHIRLSSTGKGERGQNGTDYRHS